MRLYSKNFSKIMYVLLQFLWFFTCASWGISPAQILLIVQTTAICHSIFYFSSFYLCLFNLEFQNVVICFFCSFLCSFLLSIFFPSYSYLLFFLFPVLFSPSVYSLYFLISLTVFFSNLLSFLFSFPITLFSLLLPYALFLFNLFSF